jgi:hypothetical protein
VETKIYVSDGLLCKELEIDTLPKGAQRGHLAAADIFVKCAICEENTAMSSNDCRAQGVFVCDKCKAAILHIRKLLEDGGSVV